MQPRSLFDYTDEEFSLLCLNLVGLQPVTAPVGQIFCMKSRYTTNIDYLTITKSVIEG